MIFKTSTLTRLWNGGCAKLFYATRDEIAWQGSMTMDFDNFVHCKSMEYEMDVGYDLALTKSRFPKLQRDYLDLEEYEKFLDRCKNVGIKRKGSITTMLCRSHGPRGINRTKPTGNYAHGNCMIGFTFRQMPRKDGGYPILGLHSRVSYLPYMGALDLALAYVIAREIGQVLGFAVEECAFTWYCDSFQFANMQSLAYVLARPELTAALRKPKTYPSEKYPTIALMRRTEESFRTKYEEGFKPEEEKYAQLMRYRARYERNHHNVPPGPLPRIPVQSLNLDALRSPVRIRADRTQEEDDE